MKRKRTTRMRSQIFNAVLKLDPKRADARFSRGAAYYSDGDYQSAVEDFTATIDSGHGNATVFYLRGLAESELGQTAAARSDLEHAFKLDPHLQPRQPGDRWTFDRPGGLLMRRGDSRSK